jgi:hypothetical protein
VSDTTGTHNSATMILRVIGGALVIAGAFFRWIAPATSAKGTSMPISLFWSTEFSTTDSNPSFFASAGFIVILIGAVTLVGALLNRGGWVLYGGILALIAFVLIAISLMRVEVADIGIGDYGLIAWAIGLGAVVSIVAALAGRRSRA